MTPLVRAALACVLACAFFAGASALGKAALTILPGPDLHPLQVTAARFLFAFLALTPFLVIKGRDVFRTAIPLRHLQRVLLGVGGIACIFTAVEVLPLADVTSVARASPLFAMIFAGWFLRERVDGARWTAALIGFAGVAVMMRPGAATFEPMALIALAAAVFTGAEIVTIRLLAARDPRLTVLAINNALGALIACSIAAFVFVSPSWQQLIAMAGIGVVMVSGQALILQAFRIAEASVVAPFYFSTVVWSVLIGVVVFDEPPGWHLYLGASLIIGAGAYVAWRGSKR
jgi:drug/metabolite transporter (DMT)-like permease